MKQRIIGITLALLLISVVTFAASSLNAAYQLATDDAGKQMTKIVEHLDLNDFEERYGVNLSDREETLVRMALLAYADDVHSLPGGEVQTRTAGTSQTYIGNKKTRVFHEPSCSSVGSMKDSNKITLESRQEAIMNGYKPCGRCNP